MSEVQSLNSINDAPKYWAEYKLLVFALVCLCLSVSCVYIFEKQWVTLLASCLSLIWFIVQIEVAKGSTLRNASIRYETYLKTLNKKQLNWLVEEVSIDDETKQFVIDFVKHHQIRLREAPYV